MSLCTALAIALLLPSPAARAAQDSQATQDTQAAPAPARADLPPSGPHVVLVAPDGGERAVALADLEVDQDHPLGAALVRCVDFVAPPAAPQQDPVVAELAGGEVLVGSVLAGEGETVQLRLGCGLDVFAELERVRALRWPARLSSAPGVAPAPEGDRLYRVQGGGVERIDGAVEEFTARGVRFHGELVGTLDVPWTGVAALFVEHLAAAEPAGAVAGTPVAVDLDDGSRLRGGLVRLSASGLDLERGGERLRLALAHVLLVAADDGRVGFLSALAPSSAEPSRPFGDDLGMVWPHRVDRAVGGGPLACAGRRYPRGIGVHAPSRLAWTLDGSQRALRGAVAIDDEVLSSSARGSVTFRVLVDGRAAFESPVLRGGDAPVPFAVDLTGARALELVADPGPDGFAGDRGDWLGLVVERAQSGSGSDTSRK